MTTEHHTAPQSYRRAPDPIRAILDVPLPPHLSLAPSRDRMLLVQGIRYPSIADLAQPKLRLAGIRVNPGNNSVHGETRYIGITVQTLADGSKLPLSVPDDARLNFPSWSPDGTKLAFTNATANEVNLFVADPDRPDCRKIPGCRLNAAYADPIGWLPDNRHLICLTIPPGRTAPPATSAVPSGPIIQESSGAPGPVRTYQDLLQNEHDEQLFDYYFTSQLAVVSVDTGEIRLIGRPGVIARVDPSPDGKHLLVVTQHRPYSYLYPWFAFPREVEVWNLAGEVEKKLASSPLQDRVPIEGVPTGPRGHHWRPTSAATIVWAEALDEGDPRNKVSHRDRLCCQAFPFAGDGREIAKVEHRYMGLTWGATAGQALVREYDRDRRWTRSRLIAVDDPNDEGRTIFDRSVNDRYGDVGSPFMRTLSSGHRVLWQDGNKIFLHSEGATPNGDRPFYDSLDLTTLQTVRLFQSDDCAYEQVVAVVSADGSQFITRAESPVNPPNYFLRTVDRAERKPLTDFIDPTPQIRLIRKEIVTYKRSDGVPLSFTLYLPPEYMTGERRPTIVWAYPREFSDGGTAGQVSGSANRFTTIQGISHLFLLLQGYVVLDNTTMPVVGDAENVNDTYVEQIVANAQAAVDKAVELGVTDRERIGLGGHSYGAFMTANLLAHTSLFRAGVARSGAYNRTLTPFGFQSERRTLWEAPEVYMKLSPFMVADKIKTPLLLIHGAEDDNSGTFPMQSERLYQAIRGNGGTTRLVVLPYESHGYQARESVEHTLWEMVDWFAKYL